MLDHPMDLEKMTAEQAIQGTIEMWSDMMDILGERPSVRDRFAFKELWLVQHGYSDVRFGGIVMSGNCFLCEYNDEHSESCGCDNCPIRWPDSFLVFNACKSSALDYRRSSIPDILAYLKNKENWRENQDGSSV